jgi:hypothetical protein
MIGVRWMYGAAVARAAWKSSVVKGVMCNGSFRKQRRVRARKSMQVSDPNKAVETPDRQSRDD